MMRVRIPGGQLSSDQLRAIGGISKEYGRDVADITDRQNVQFHWIRIEDVPMIWERLAEVGLSSIQACGDVPRNILGCPVAGIDDAEILDASEVLRATEEVAATQPASSATCRASTRRRSPAAPRTARRTRSTTSPSSASSHDGRKGFDLWVGGGLSTNPMLAKRLGTFVTAEQVPEVWAGVTRPVPRLRLPPAAQPAPA